MKIKISSAYVEICLYFVETLGTEVGGDGQRSAVGHGSPKANDLNSNDTFL